MGPTPPPTYGSSATTHLELKTEARSPAKMPFSATSTRAAKESTART
jgi:hypothetical protein